MACKKAAFPSRRSAEGRLAEIQRKAEDRGPLHYVPTRIYRCNSCRQYHLTSNPPKWRR